MGCAIEFNREVTHVLSIEVDMAITDLARFLPYNCLEVLTVKEGFA